MGLWKKAKPRIWAMRSDSHGCGHYRIHANLRAAVERGLVDAIEINHNGEPVDWEDDIRFAWADIVWTQRLYERAQIDAVIAARARHGFCWGYDIDDDLDGIDPSNPAYAYFKDRGQDAVLENFHSALSQADVVTVSTEELANKLRRWNPGATEVWPNRLEFTLWRQLSETARGGRFRIAWWGGNSHIADAVEFFPALPALLDEFPQVDILLFGYMPTRADYRRTAATGQWIDPHRFDFEAFYARYGDRVFYEKFVPITVYHGVLPTLGIACAVAPLADTPFNRCRSNIKLLEASAIGVPMIAQDLPPYNGSRFEDGSPVARLVRTEEEWTSELRRMVAEEEWRRERAARAFAWVREHFDAHAAADGWVTRWAGHRARTHRLPRAA